MNIDDHINYWRESAAYDLNTMEHLFQSGDYHWSLFMGHLVIEKMLKGLFVKSSNDINPPRSHDLSLLALRAGIALADEFYDTLDRITTYNINTRYPDYKMAFYKKCTKDFSQSALDEIRELYQWLLQKFQ